MRAQGAESPLPDTLALAIPGVSQVEALEKELAKALPEPDQYIVVVVVEIPLAEVVGGLGEPVFGQLAEIAEREVS